jgi:uncharacterized membrane protein YraQ (UPF0718 family)
MHTLLEILNATWEMALAAAPWLAVGLVVAALIKVYVPSDWLTKFLHGRWGVVKAAFIGAPLPLCSCGVIPAALALRRQGASRGSTMSFLVATPETGVDSVAVSYALLGPFLAVVRPVSAILSAIVTGLLGAALPEPVQAGSPAVSSDPKASTNTAGKPASTGGCCGGTKKEPEPAPVSSCCSSSKPTTSCCETAAPKASCCETEKVETKSSCCATEAQTPAPASSCCSTKAEPASSCCSTKTEPASSCCSSKSASNTASKPNVFTALIDAAAEVLGDTMKWLLIGLLMAGTISVFITGDTLAGWGSGLPVMLLMAVVGVPMYICATASTPLAAALLLAGLSPGAVLVFMLAGPATNVATLGVVRKEMGTRYMVAYLVGVGVSAIGCGLATDAIANAWNISAVAQAQSHHHHEMVPQWLAITCLVLLVVLAIKPLRIRLFAPTPQPA